MATTTVTGAPYVVTFEESGGFPWSEVLTGFAAVGTFLAVAAAIYVARVGIAANRDAAHLAQRRASALRITEWLAAVTHAVDVHVLLRHLADPAISQPTDDGWSTAILEIERGHERLSSEVRIVFGHDEGLTGSLDDLLHVLRELRKRHDEWRDEAAFIDSGLVKKGGSGWLKLKEPNIDSRRRVAYGAMVQMPYVKLYPMARSRLERLLIIRTDPSWKPEPWPEEMLRKAPPDPSQKPIQVHEDRGLYENYVPNNQNDAP